MINIFVYGTLRAAGTRPIPVIFPSAIFVGEGYTQGSLFDFGAYPGFVLAENSTSPGIVKGEVYHVTDEMIAAMDEIERYDANDIAGSYYWRKQTHVVLDGRQLLCDVYEVNPAYYALQNRILAGDWIAHVAQKGALPEERWPDDRPILMKMR